MVVMSTFNIQDLTSDNIVFTYNDEETSMAQVNAREKLDVLWTTF
jgi:hypothetical protein